MQRRAPIVRVETAEELHHLEGIPLDVRQAALPVGEAAQRLETIRSLADYITKGVARLGGTLRIPAEPLARVLLATNDGITLASHLDGEDLYDTFLQLVMSSVGPPQP